MRKRKNLFRFLLPFLVFDLFLKRSAFPEETDSLLAFLLACLLIYLFIYLFIYLISPLPKLLNFLGSLKNSVQAALLVFSVQQEI